MEWKSLFPERSCARSLARVHMYVRENELPGEVIHSIHCSAEQMRARARVRATATFERDPLAREVPTYTRGEQS